MKATCPNECKSFFVTTAHVMEEWLVDERGDWVETRETLETTHGPDTGNIWTCDKCGAAAKVE